MRNGDTSHHKGQLLHSENKLTVRRIY